MIRLSIVVPCYNEEDVLPETYSAITSKIIQLQKSNKISDSSKIYFVDDGSTDKTWDIIEKLVSDKKDVAGIKLSRNYGHQNALMAGLFLVEGDAIITIDADLQDDIDIIEEMVDAYFNGSEIVYGVRKQRDKDTMFKRGSANAFYKLMKLMGVDIIFNHSDYRLMSRNAVECLKKFEERNLFLRGIIPLLGLSTSKVYYDRIERIYGESKYSLGKMLNFAWEGITSFSIIPLRLISLLGVSFSFFAVAISIWVLYIKIYTDRAIPGWASLSLPLLIIGAVQLLAIGVVGEYIGKIYLESKHRPRYLIEKVI